MFSAGTQLGKAARNSKLRGLRHTVMDHLGGGIDCTLAADENDAPPVPLLHARQIRTAQAHTAEHVDLEEPPPFLVGNINVSQRAASSTSVSMCRCKRSVAIVVILDATVARSCASQSLGA
jgi:hypothetical protein